MNDNYAPHWQAFKDALRKAEGQYLLFRYERDHWIDPSYHITEIKQATITSVDCGGKMNHWNEVIIQLWIPPAEKNSEPMTVKKALSIIAVVEGKLDIDPKSTVKVEYGHSGFDTRQMLPASMVPDETSIIVTLVPDVTQCKAGETCGLAESEKVEVTACCTPSSGCC